ncbi:MAG: hypothetical protein RSF33_07885 [Hydrogenoanaerobacterium sp.]
MCKFAMNREMLGNRVTGYMVYESKTMEFVGMTVKQIKDMLAGGEAVHGFILEESGELSFDTAGFKTDNMMCRSGINTLTPVNATDCVVNVFYIVTSVNRSKNSNTYEVVNSRYGRSTITESKLKTLMELGAVQGGVYLDNKNKLCTCEGVRVVEADSIEETGK